MTVYPKNIGTWLTKSSFDSSKLPELKRILNSQKTILRVYGLAGTGKGTLSKLLSETFEIPIIDTGSFFRVFAYTYLELELDLNDQNSHVVASKIKISIENNRVVFEVDGKKVDFATDLKGDRIDAKVPDIAKSSLIRDKVYHLADNLIDKKLTTACVVDGRGAYEPMFIWAQDRGQPVIRILLDLNDTVSEQRYIQANLNKKRLKNPEFNFSEAELKLQKENFRNSFLVRNQKDRENIKQKAIGLISPDSGVIDTSYLTPQEVLQTALSWISSSVSPVLSS